MFKTKFSRFSRFLTALVAAAMLVAFIPQAVFAASVPTLSITSVKAGESVTVHGDNFPKNTEFTVRMDKMGNLALNGTVVGTVNSGSGSFDATFNIPSALKTESLIAIRMDSTSGWYSYNWFSNKSATTTVTPTPSTSTKPYIEVVAVKANESITVQGYRFPANETFKIRIGSFYNFFKDYVVVDSLYSGTGGSIKFTVKLPESVKNVEWVTVRVDSEQKNYAFNAFKNVSAGTVSPISTPLPPMGTCEVLSTSPTKVLGKYEDFDAVWTVKNTSKSNWELSEVDYKYVSGTKLQKYNSLYDITATVKPGEIIKIVVDMTAPATNGTYAANWALVKGSTTLCTLPLTVTVK